MCFHSVAVVLQLICLFMSGLSLCVDVIIRVCLIELHVCVFVCWCVCVCMCVYLCVPVLQSIIPFKF